MSEWINTQGLDDSPCQRRINLKNELKDRIDQSKNEKSEKQVGVQIRPTCDSIRSRFRRPPNVLASQRRLCERHHSCELPSQPSDACEGIRELDCPFGGQQKALQKNDDEERLAGNMAGEAEKTAFNYSLTERGWLAVNNLLKNDDFKTPRHKLAFIRTTMSQYTVFFGNRPDFVICGSELWEDLIFAWREEQRELFDLKEATPVMSGLPQVLTIPEPVAIVDGIVLVRDSEVEGMDYYLASTTEFQRVYFGRDNTHVIDVETAELSKVCDYTMKSFPDFTVRVFEDISKEALYWLMLRIIRKLQGEQNGVDEH